ncbi:MAG: hypothetical protein V3U51_00915 [Thermoplasmata archaeon]
MPAHDGGKPIVLTSSRAEISRYSGDPFAAFIATFPHKWIPKWFLKGEWSIQMTTRMGQPSSFPTD